MQKKYAGQPALFLGKKIIHVGVISSKKQYDKIIARLLKKYPGIKEEDIGFTFIYGDRNYILACK